LLPELVRQQNTFTGRLTETTPDDVFLAARRIVATSTAEILPTGDP
jgi:hypothetical protein